MYEYFATQSVALSAALIDFEVLRTSEMRNLRLWLLFNFFLSLSLSLQVLLPLVAVVVVAVAVAACDSQFIWEFGFVSIVCHEVGGLNAIIMRLSRR